MDEYEISDELADLAVSALEHGFASISDGKSGPLIPFVMTDEPAGKNLHRFVDDTLHDAVKAAQGFVSTLETTASRYAIAIDGFITIDGARSDAIIVEAGERDAPAGVLFYQRYRKKKGLLSKGFETVGNPVLGDTVDLRF